MPMYFFFCNLSFADVGFTSRMVPKMIVGIHTHSSHLLHGLPETDVSIIFGCMDNLLLTVMAYDHFLDSLLHSFIVLQVTCFMDVEISNFFCDPSQLLSLACSDSFTNDIVRYLVGIIYGFFPISGILFYYYKIVSSILRVPSPGGMYRAVSTCGSHLSVVCLFYGTAIGVYFSSAFSVSPGKGALASVVYTVVTPMLNSFIYSLRNRGIKRALWRLLRKTGSPQSPCHVSGLLVVTAAK
ncbi:olfactory receptor 7E178-like [Oryctolagus cuniculus]|uniref:olfactory receptor 7E178-like n=1 Tax=Oryctolagus cuniculus TaxID=9986 RepID=UPI00387A48B3